MEIYGFNKSQMKIADMMWAAQDMDEVDAIIDTFGIDGIVVRDMMLAATFDDHQEVELSEPYLKKFMLK